MTEVDKILSAIELDVEKLLSSTLFDSTCHDFKDTGVIVSVKDGIVTICGLNEAAVGDLVRFSIGVFGIVMDMHDYVHVILLDSDTTVSEGQSCVVADKKLSVPTGKSLLGRVVDGLGRPIDGKGDICSDIFYDIENPAPGIIARKSVSESLQTGIKAIDVLIPIGRGQRELILGDRRTGKTTIAIDAILNQGLGFKNNDPVYCIYVSIGQSRSEIARFVHNLKSAGAMDYSIVVAASASDPVSLQYLAPYTGTAMAEYFRDNSMHALIVYDDLSKHAVVYRQMSLLLRRPPGREAYPGDVFYLHSRLLERSAKLADKDGGGSLTALPIIETQAGDISSYIPTNLISITDGQLFLETSLFNQGIKPAISMGLSVSRVGSSAQTKIIKSISGGLKLQLAQYRELEAFSKFGEDLDPDTIKSLTDGKILVNLLKQEQGNPLSILEQYVTIFPGLCDDIDLIGIDIDRFRDEIVKTIRNDYHDFNTRISSSGYLSDEDKLSVIEILKEVIYKCRLDGYKS